MKKASATIDTHKTTSGRYIASILEVVNGKLYEYDSPDYDTPHAAYRNAIRRLHERHWKVLKTGKTESVI